MTIATSHRIWWVGACVAGLAVFVLMVTYLYQPVLQTISFMLGRPYFADCSTGIRSEGSLEGERYRITQHFCGPDSRAMYVVFLLRPNDWAAVPLLHSVGSPVPQEVRRKDAQSYDVIFAGALHNGTSRVPVTLDATGFPERYYGFRHGHPED
jgi:hypothetical protein